MNPVTVPTSIKPYIIPPDGSRPYLEEIQTTEEPILTLTRPNEVDSATGDILSYIDRRDEIDWLFLYLPEDVLKDGDEGTPKSLEDLRRNEGVYQPNIRLLPDTRLRWNDEGWKKRGLYGMVGYHLFYTLAKGEPLTPNPYVAGKVSGDMFLLQASDDIDSGWRRFYVDVSSEIGFSSEGGKTYIEGPHIGRLEYR